MSTITFYHYTDEDGKTAILQTKVIKQSDRNVGDAAFGKGVYGNNMSPELFSKEELAKNNYDSSPNYWEDLLDVGRVDWAIKITLTANRVKKIRDGTRDILLHVGDIDLNKYNYEVIEVPDY